MDEHHAANATHAHGGDALQDLMERFGTDLALMADTKTREMKDLVSLENSRRLLSLQIGQAQMIDVARHMSDLLRANFKDGEQRKRTSLLASPEASRRSRSECGEDALVVSVMLANNLPKMDLLGECSAYCVLWVDNAPSSGTCVTSTVDRNANPCFNESFQWECSSETSKLYISVWCVPATCVCLCVCVCVRVCTDVCMHMDVYRWLGGLGLLPAAHVRAQRFCVYSQIPRVRPLAHPSPNAYISYHRNMCGRRDRDVISSDDLVGCVTVDLPDLPYNKQVQLTRPLLNPAISRKLLDTTITIAVTKQHRDSLCSVAAARAENGQVSEPAPPSTMFQEEENVRSLVHSLEEMLA